MTDTVERELKADEGQEGWEQGESRVFRKEDSESTGPHD